MFPSAIRTWKQCPHMVRTLSPFPATKRNLAFDELQHMQLQHRVLDFQYPLQDCLLSDQISMSEIPHNEKLTSMISQSSCIAPACGYDAIDVSRASA